MTERLDWRSTSSDGYSATPPPPQPDLLAHEPRRPHRMLAWTTLGVVSAAAVAAGVYFAGGGTGNSAQPSSDVVAALAASTSSPSPSQSPAPGMPGRGRHLGPRDIFGRFEGNLLHGEATVQTRQGIEVVDVQRGRVIGVSATSITVQSTDNVTFTYVVTGQTKILDLALPRGTKATISDVKVGDTVRIWAVRSGSTRTARLIVDGQLPRHAPGTPSPSPSPSGAAA